MEETEVEVLWQEIERHAAVMHEFARFRDELGEGVPLKAVRFQLEAIERRVAQLEKGEEND